ncbi:sigma-70 family RNA polymerase sigma factor [Dietzia maris]|uniref:sigma-70 family RNA polymerase sigma factor n=1 Tax=Dietzia maris TaxID=37915 RepID=UPI0037C99114
MKRLPPILTASEARQAARDVELGIYASHLLETLRPGAVTRGFIRDLKTIAEEGRLAREILTVSNLRLVHHWSSWVSEVYGPDWAEDAFQAGCLGLIRGVDGWDYTKGFAFSTYASWHIRQQIQRWRMNETSLIRVPVHVYERMKDGGEGLSVELREAADRAFKVRLLEDLTDLESVLWEDGGVGSVVEDSSIRQIVHLLFAALTSREIDVLSYRFGFRTGGEPLTLDEIGKIFGLTRERIRQIEKAALKKLVELRVSDPRDSV